MASERFLYPCARFQRHRDGYQQMEDWRGDWVIDFCGGTLHTPSVVPQKPTHSAPVKNENEYLTFESALRKVLSVPHSALKAHLDAEKRARRQRTKRASVRASRAKD